METQIYAGIDVSKSSLDLAINNKFLGKYPNDPKGHKAIIQEMKRCSPQIVCLESTGSLSKRLVNALHEAKIPCVEVQPLRVKLFIKSLGRLAKTDKIDAMSISLFAKSGVENNILKPQLPKSPELIQLNELVERHNSLANLLRQEKARLKNSVCDSKEVIKSIKRTIEHLNKEKALIDAKIEKDSSSVPEFAEKKELLCSVIGIKTIIACIILTKLPELGTLNRRAIAALCGVAPYNKDSGKSIHGVRKTGGGRIEVRNALFLTAMNCSRCDGFLRDFYLRLIARGKTRKVALIAVIRKLVIILNVMIAKKEKFNRNFCHANCTTNCGPTVS